MEHQKLKTVAMTILTFGPVALFSYFGIRGFPGVTRGWSLILAGTLTLGWLSFILQFFEKWTRFFKTVRDFFQEQWQALRDRIRRGRLSPTLAEIQKKIREAFKQEGISKPVILAINGFTIFSHSGLLKKASPATKTCEPFKTAPIVILDTAWDFVKDDEWKQFLILLKKLRKRPTLDGLVIVLDGAQIDDNLARGNSQCAQLIREKIEDVTEELGLHIPVQLVITHCDTIPGFDPFFATNNTDEKRAEGWGFKLNEAEHNQLSNTLTREGDLLFQSLRQKAQHLLLERKGVDAQTDLEIYLFPWHFKARWDKIQRFVEALFTPLTDESPRLRGVYLTSTNQGGYFIHDLFTKWFLKDLSWVHPTKRVTEQYYRNRRLWTGIVFA